MQKYRMQPAYNTDAYVTTNVHLGSSQQRYLHAIRIRWILKIHIVEPFTRRFSRHSVYDIDRVSRGVVGDTLQNIKTNKSLK